MAATLLGLTLTFGTGATISGLVLQTAGAREAVSIVEAADEDGDFVASALYGRKVTGTLEAIDNGYTGTIGSLVTVAGFPTGNFYVTEKSQTRTNTGFMRRTIGVTSWGF